MAKCSGCSGDRCSCIVRAGANVTVTGVGTVQNPYIVSASEGSGSAGSVPPGSVIMFGGPSAPAGWLVANGAAVSRSAYAALFANIGTAYGVGDNNTTFNLPNFGGRFPLGPDTTHPRGASGGSFSRTLSVAQMPVHAHSMAHAHNIDHAHPQATSHSQNRNHTHTGSTSTSGWHAHSGVTEEAGYHTHNFYRASNATSLRTSGSGAQTFPFEFDNNIPTTGAGVHQHQFFTNGEGAHTHTVVLSTESANHEHIVDTPAFYGWTGAMDYGSTGNNGSGAAVDTTPPWVGIQFIIKT